MPRPAVRLEAFDAVRHEPLLATWLRRPHVSRWWGDPETVLRDVRNRPEQGGHALIVADGSPVGYLRWQRASRADLDEAGLTEIPDGAVDIDILIGEPAQVGRGIGPAALRLLLGRLAAEADVPLAGMVTSVENHAAIRAYEKAGFHRLRQFDDPAYGRCWVLVADLRPRG